MIITLTTYTIILLLAYIYGPKNKIYNIDIDIKAFICLLIGGWIVIFAYNVYKLKLQKQRQLTIADILPLIYHVIVFIIVLPIVADNLPDR